MYTYVQIYQIVYSKCVIFLYMDEWFFNVLWVNKDIKVVCFLFPSIRTHKYDAKIKFLLIVEKVWLFYRCLSMITKKGKLIA